MKTIIGILVVLSAMISGCQSTKPIELTGTGRGIAASDIALVKISEADRSRIDPMLQGSRRFSVNTGPIWNQVFVGDAGSPLFTIKSAELRTSFEGAGFVVRFTYVVSGSLTINSRTIAIEAQGTRAAGPLTKNAMREAVESGVIEAAAKAKAITDAVESASRLTAPQ
jgi:hypothetical protein